MIIEKARSDLRTILVVEDDDAVAEMVVEHLRATVDAEVIRTCSARETLQLDLENPPDLVLADLLLPDGNGLDLVRLLRADHGYPVLIMTGEPTMGRIAEAMRLGAADVFTKPFDLQRLTRVVIKSLEAYRRKQKAERRTERLEKLVRKVIEDRKSLQRRVDLVCKDLVGAYRDLAKRVAGTPQFGPDSEP